VMLAVRRPKIRAMSGIAVGCFSQTALA
jgi:hypothetical protein